MQLLTGILGSAHGLRGELKVDIRTDNPSERFVKGNKIQTNNADFPVLTVRGFRVSNNKFFLSFQEINDRTMAEKMCFTKLYVDSKDVEEEEDSFYPHELRGLKVYDLDDNYLGVVKDMLLGKAQDLLVIEPSINSSEDADEQNNESIFLEGNEAELVKEQGSDGEKADIEDVLLPFVYELVVEVNLEDEYVLVDPPGGLFPSN
ncbi:16S rRNA processing protein RimM [Actinomyces sp. zg-332]|uniref:ribosome maturation factor RimM n=1 Tax=Actinomyces sp. zg-332 TaxID=2708340 RepID=UPI0014208F1A|nr:ribosome maturation factor RimM [Actinomyces sp. zg-332]QPK93765.1 16S rRNA processing protein RimM [Actinomyces sp. zg-332]